MNRLQRLTLTGFKSIKAIDLEFNALNILIGANGAGKSNLISFFKMLNEMMAGRFQFYIGANGRASSILHFGPKTTLQIEARLEFQVTNGVDTYGIRLFHVMGDTLMFAEETISFQEMNRPYSRMDQLGAGHQEAKIGEAVEEKPTAKILKYLLDRCRVYHFHDTSATANVRESCYVRDNRWLMPDAGNLAALLLRFREEEKKSYQQIVGTIRLIAPFFDDFVIEPDASRRVMLNWKEKDSDQVFGPHIFSDGTLRSICLATLLLQPKEELPKLIIVDEPELGLHPYALNIIADLFKRAALHTQILISTQSSSFLDNFEPEDVIAVDREGKESKFKRLSSEELEIWLDEYSLGEVWEKNIAGGGPH
ncbi:AAA family ATPase [Oscillatoria acuminata]|uniref:Putative ATPase n=1 Tax=Oscillatoria acuminata PCC 6304 TaxID=56110 RepID=K9TIJ8_9CYAN|nr:AAA family ATPase [Oscillatoria acuminata]AFY82365.1 putative ATPase [Oscillatoria acuminata PCC 6304]